MAGQNLLTDLIFLSGLGAKICCTHTHTHQPAHLLPPPRLLLTEIAPTDYVTRLIRPQMREGVGGREDDIVPEASAGYEKDKFFTLAIK